MLIEDLYDAITWCYRNDAQLRYSEVTDLESGNGKARYVVASVSTGIPWLRRAAVGRDTVSAVKALQDLLRQDSLRPVPTPPASSADTGIKEALAALDRTLDIAVGRVDSETLTDLEELLYHLKGQVANQRSSTPSQRRYQESYRAKRRLLRKRISAEPPVESESVVCEHEWTDARNEVVLSGEICLKCGAIRAGNQQVGEPVTRHIFPVPTGKPLPAEQPAQTTLITDGMSASEILEVARVNLACAQEELAKREAQAKK